ncbi:hypothetical protein EUGRSUZ_J02278 [Eucalyptus grandis]|uniref:C2H2-type domain-containing protein n=2 Tax=Eucalyptus grandis TaxID=71139 RepID=A0A059AH62_EUCGR|nr:hypothetical protein EUGRSUZ_J02278 [Eucalyptus grandis]
MPFIEKERYQLPNKCRLHPDYNFYGDQEQHKIHVDINEWRCGYCRKSFYEEKYLDRHFDNRHYDLLNVSQGKCLADLCGALHCDLVMDSVQKKTKCNPAAAVRNKHLCESLADSCFPVKEGPSSSRLHEFFLRQFCDAHTCNGRQKPFSKGRRVKKKHILHRHVYSGSLAVATVLSLCLLVSKGNKKRYTRFEARHRKYTEEKTVLSLWVHKLLSLIVSFSSLFSVSLNLALEPT